MFIDIHCHILPGVDDGADSFDEACEMIKIAKAVGTTIMVATPHFNNRAQCRSGINKQIILDRYKSLKEIVVQNEIGVNLFLGSELLVNGNFSHLYKTDNILTVNGTRYLLVEFNFDEKIYNVRNYIDEIISYGFIPVIAHPERYHFFSESYDEIYRILSKGCLFQVNKGSPLNKYGETACRISKWLLNNDMVHLFACDSHGVSHRNADMSELYEWLVDLYPISKINKWVHDNPKRILLDMNI